MEHRCRSPRWVCAGVLAVALAALGPAHPAHAESSSWEPGTLITNKRAMRIFVVPGPEQCRDACLANGRCQAWNFESSGGPQTRARNRCGLFSRVEGKRPVRGRSAALTIAGVKQAESDPARTPEGRPANGASLRVTEIVHAGVKQAAAALPSRRELARRKKREAAVRTAAVEAGIKHAAAAMAREADAARLRAAAWGRTARGAVEEGASTLPSAWTLARLRREADRQRTAWIAGAVKEGALALPSPASLARMRRETSALIAAIEAAAVERSASVLIAAATQVRLQREASVAAISGAVGEGASALQAAAERMEARAATMAAGMAAGASRLAAEGARAREDAAALRAGAELGGVRQGASMLRAAPPAARPSAKEAASPDRPAPPEPPLAVPARRSTWEPGLSLLGQPFAYDERGVGASAGYRLRDAEACRDLCLEHARCRGWKFNGADYPHPRLRNLCFLISGSPARIGSNVFGVISGVIDEAR